MAYPPSILQTPPAEARPASESPPRPRALATAALVGGLVATFIVAWGQSPSEVAQAAAIGVGLALVGSFGLDVIGRWGALLRADLVCLVALYYLTFAEFLLPQPQFDGLARDMDSVQDAIGIVMLGMASMAVGRHFGFQTGRFRLLETQWLPPRSILLLFWGCAAVGYLHMLQAVGFSPMAMVSAFLGPRFSVPWGRAQYGDVTILLYELGATIYLVPPLAGLILGNRGRFSKLAVITVSAMLAFTMFYAFTTGTRNIMGAFLITFVVAHFYSSGGRNRVPLLAGAAMLMLASTIYGLQFRDMGLRAYLEGGAQVESSNPDFYVDYNLLTISHLVAAIPSVYPFVGWEAPLWLLVRVVPRFLWPGKPSGEAVSPQSYLAVPDGTTLSATFVGEAYMWSGALGVMIAGLALGFLASWWTSKTFSRHSDFGILLYGSGFFAVVITMRSIYMLPVAALPIIALFVLGRLAASRKRRMP